MRGPLAPAFAAALLFSVAGSFLMLAVPLYTLQLFDRVLPTGHGETLVMLSVGLVVVVVAWGALDALRNALLARIGTKIVDRLADDIVVAAADPASSMPTSRALRELDLVRNAVSGPPMQAFFETPWVPVGLLAVTILHPILGGFALASACLLLFLGWLNNFVTMARSRKSHELVMEASACGDAIHRRRDVVRAMGMAPALRAMFHSRHRQALMHQQKAAERGGWLNGLVRACRLLVQAGIMGLGAWLVIQRELTPGALIAGSILASRALAPIEQLLGSWRTLMQAKESLARLAAIKVAAPRRDAMHLPAPTGEVSAEDVSFLSSDGRPILSGVGFSLRPGQVLGIVGPSGAGKTTLCRLLAGCIVPSRGIVRFDGADLSRLSPERIGKHIGYLAQDAGLLAGTVAENIARMDQDRDPQKVVEAAKAAQAHAMILHLPQGYDTPLQDGGAPLSGGQRQRVGLARALYGNPAILLLDEPNAHMDGEGEAALLDTLHKLKANGMTIAIIAHKPNMLSVCDLVLVLANGKVNRLGPRDEILKSLVRSVA